jgi:hypothetical protein
VKYSTIINTILTTANSVTNGLRIPAMTQNVNIVQLDQKNQASAFRMWVQNLWIQNCEEHLTFGEEPFKIKEYWDRYKFWLKREYKHQKAKTK